MVITTGSVVKNGENGAHANNQRGCGAGKYRLTMGRVASRAIVVLTAVALLHASPEDIRLSQIGFATSGPKTAVVVSPQSWNFTIRNPQGSKIFYTAELSAQKVWSTSAESLKVADFSKFTEEGEYVVWVEGKGPSHPFTITNSCYNDALRGLIRAFYYQRASTSLPTVYAGKWARAAGHPDNEVVVHPSAASDPSMPGARSAGYTCPSPKGWYDAGDYGKYTVNAGISTYQLLLLYEQFAPYFNKLSLTIPESNNTLPDILDEIKWELDWLLTMQDPADGGVYHKITDKSFIGDLMPALANEQRYFIGKGAAATFDFAAVLAVAYRIYNTFLPTFADSCLAAATYAWEWGQQYPDSTFRNPPDVVTGEYGDTRTGDEKLWAGYELFIATGDSAYFRAGDSASSRFVAPAWPDVALLGCYSLALQKGDSLSKMRIVKVAEELVKRIPTHPYRTTMQTNDYYWGSNGVAANQGMAMLVAYLLTDDIVYLEGAIHTIDYLFGRNATGYCFVTGFGKKPSQFPHHRPSTADGFAPPVPGLLVGGPNPGSRSGENCTVEYPKARAQSYLDNTCSFTTNEVAINWNAPAAFLVGGVASLLQTDSTAISRFNARYVDKVAPEVPVVQFATIGADRVTMVVSSKEVVSVVVAVKSGDASADARTYPSLEDDSCTMVLDGLRPGVKYSVKIQLIDAAGNVQVYHDSITTVAGTPDIPELYRPSLVALPAGVGHEVAFEAPAGVAADLLYAQGGSTLVSTVPFSGSGLQLSATIPPAAITDRGVRYQVRISQGADTIVTPFRGVSLKATALRCTTFALSKTYRMVSLPGSFDNLQSLSVFGSAFGDTAQWRYFTYGGDSSAYVAYNSIKSASGGWVYAEVPAAVSVTTDCYAPDAPVQVHLKSGWNCVGNPFTFPIYWDNTEVQIGDAAVRVTEKAAQRLLRRQVFTYEDTISNARNDGSYRTNRNLVSHVYSDSTIIKPWSACWVYAEADSVVCMLSPEVKTRTAPLAKKSIALLPEWLFEVSLASGDLHEGPLVFGKAQGAHDTYDAFDTPKPPTPGALLKAGFSAVNKQGKTVALIGAIGDIGNTSGGRWELSVETRTGLPLQVTWSRRGVAGEPVYLFDETSGLSIDMQQVQECLLPASNAAVRTLTFHTSQALAAAAAIPVKWEFSAVAGRYPRFLYAVPPTSGNRGEVRIAIYDIRGRLVQSFSRQHQVPGRYSIDWDGLAKGGAIGAQGLYVARMYGDHFTKSVSFQILR